MSSSLVASGLRSAIRALALALILPVTACGPSSGVNPDGGGGGGGDGGGGGCVDGTNQCSGQSFQTCQNGQWVDTQTCAPPTFCNTTSGCIECFPGQNYCDGNDVYKCNADGTKGDLVESCTGGKQCGGGVCADLCADAAANNSYIGCEYWAVDLDNAIEVLDAYNILTCALEGGVQLKNVAVCANNANTVHGLCDPRMTCTEGGYSCKTMDICGLDAQHSPFAVVVSNPQTFDVDVTVANGAGTTSTVTVGAGKVSKIFPQMSGFTDQSTDETEQASKAYKVTSTAPIVAYQFNPLDNANVFSNDGSLLIPRTTFDKKYFGLSWPTLNRRNVAGGGTPKNDYNGYLVIVAWQDDTQIRVTPKGNIRQGETMDAIAAGTATDFTLNAFDVLELEADNTTAAPSQDLTGTLIEGLNDKSFGVFGGHEATVISNHCCADHIEEMMFPASTWGKDYAVARSQDRGTGEADVIRVMAQEDGTNVTFNPAPSSGTCPTLNTGDFCEVQIKGDTEISGDKPIMIGHYLVSVIDPVTGTGTGDPALALAVPTEQFRESYTFLVPNEYAKQYVSVVAGANTSVSLDMSDVTSQLTAFGSGSYKAARIEVQPGQHQISCPGGCGIEVYGYDNAVSYLFAGGLDLKTIVVN